MKRNFQGDLHRLSEQMLKAGKTAGRKVGDIAHEALQEGTAIWHRVLSENGHPATPSSEPSTQKIAARAYEIWKSKGCPSGTSEEDWGQAERELCHRSGTV